MPRNRIPIVIPVDAGLDLANSPAALRAGKLVRAQNKAPGLWGPRQGTTFIDRANRGRSNPSFNGSTSFCTGYYNSTQMDLGRKWSIDVLIKIGTLSATNPQIIFGFGDANMGGVRVRIHTDGEIQWHCKDADDNTAYIPASVGDSAAHSNGTVVHSRLTRNDGTFNAYVDSVLEGTDTATFTAGAAMKVVAESMLVGKPAGYHSNTDYFSGVLGYIIIRNFVDTDFTYAYSELPNPRGDDVVAAWMGELIESDALVKDCSKYANPLVCSNIASGSRVPELHEPVQSIKAATTLDGRLRNMVLVGGQLYSEVV